MSESKLQLPSRQSAIQLSDAGYPILVTNAGVPPLLPGYVLVKTCAVALNPSDHKILTNYPIPGAFVGTDFSGVVVEVADNVKTEAIVGIGEWVCGAAFCFAPEHRLSSGSFSEYVRVRASLLLHIPTPLSSPAHSVMGFQEAATLGTAIATCILALWSPDALGLPGNPDKPHHSSTPVPVLVYGGSTATGTIAIQLLRLSGYQPITTCSSHNFDLVSGRGASAVFDYSDPDAIKRVKDHTGGRLKYVLDCISDPASARFSYAVIQRPGGRYVSLEAVPAGILAVRRAVRPCFVLAAEACGEEIKLGHQDYDRPVNHEKYELFTHYRATIVQPLLQQGKLKAHPIQQLEGGLHGVLKGLEFMATGGTVSGKKLVATINGTTC